MEELESHGFGSSQTPACIPAGQRACIPGESRTNAERPYMKYSYSGFMDCLANSDVGLLHRNGEIEREANRCLKKTGFISVGIFNSQIWEHPIRQMFGLPPGEQLWTYSYSPQEMARLLLIARKNVYGILDGKDRDKFEFITIADRRRITRESFERWYAGQSRYRKLCDRLPEEIAEFGARRLRKEWQTMAS